MCCFSNKASAQLLQLLLLLFLLLLFLFRLLLLLLFILRSLLCITIHLHASDNLPCKPLLLLLAALVCLVLHVKAIQLLHCFICCCLVLQLQHTLIMGHSNMQQANFMCCPAQIVSSFGLCTGQKGHSSM